MDNCEKKMTASCVYAVVPAAGWSRRMGRTKQLLDVNGQPMLLGILQSLAASQAAGVSLVTQSAIAAQLDLNKFPNLFVSINDDPQSEMIDSVRIGLLDWFTRQTIKETDGFLICPGDHPNIATEDVDRCVAEFRHCPDRIVIAAHQGRRGHPIIFPAYLVPFVHSEKCNDGLNALTRTYVQQVRLVESRSSGVLVDIDTPDDYDQHIGKSHE